MSFVGHIIHFFIERRAQGQTYAQVVETLKSNRETVSAALRQATDTPANRLQAGHVIGMERWGAHRLSSLLDHNAPTLDEYNGYRPSQELSMSALADAFDQARATTLALAAQLEPFAGQKVPHNDIGDLSVKTWLVYLNNHASMESRAIKS
jgi:hypothetical protein